jgi:hypothetical protein
MKDGVFFFVAIAAVRGKRNSVKAEAAPFPAEAVVLRDYRDITTADR